MDKKKDNKNIKVKNDRKVKSKFAEKYQDRIVSIKESDEKAQKRKQAKTKLEQNKQEEAPKKRGRKPKKIIEE